MGAGEGFFGMSFCDFVNRDADLGGRGITIHVYSVRGEKCEKQAEIEKGIAVHHMWGSF